jgi:hypothetical protein
MENSVLDVLELTANLIYQQVYVQGVVKILTTFIPKENVFIIIDHSLNIK